MKKIFFLFIFISFVLLPLFCFAQEDSTSAEQSEAQMDQIQNNVKVKFSPSNKRDPFLSRDEVSTIERNRRAEMDRIAREKKAKEDALIAARKAEEDKLKREAYLKENPHLAIIGKIKIQGMMGDEVQINNTFKGVGDKVAGATITKITGSRIYFKYQGKTFSLPIPKPKD